MFLTPLITGDFHFPTSRFISVDSHFITLFFFSPEKLHDFDQKPADCSMCMVKILFCYPGSSALRTIHIFYSCVWMKYNSDLKKYCGSKIKEILQCVCVWSKSYFVIPGHPCYARLHNLGPHLSWMQYNSAMKNNLIQCNTIQCVTIQCISIQYNTTDGFLLKVYFSDSFICISLIIKHIFLHGTIL